MKIKIKLLSRIQNCITKKYISKILIYIILLNHFIFISNASTLSPDTRYETVTGDNIKIENIIEDDKIEVEVEGNTLINAIGTLDTCNYGTINGNEFSFIGQDNLFRLYFKDSVVKPNTAYTVFYNITKNTLKAESTSRVLKFNLNSYNEPNRGYFDIHEGQIGKYSKVFTTSEKAIIDKPYIETMTPLTGEFEMKDIMVVEGDYSDYTFEYFEGLLSVGENNNSIQIKSSNKNLFDLKIYDGVEVNNGTSLLTDNGIKITTNGSTKETVDGYMKTGISTKVSDIEMYYTQYLMNVRENTTYTLSYDVIAESVNNHDVYIEFRDKNYNSLGYKAIVSVSSKTSANVNFTSPDKAKYLHIRFDNNLGGNSLTFSNIQIEESNVYSSYESNLTNTLNISLNQPLRYLSDDVKDKIVKIDGQWMIERNVGEIVLNGSRQWAFSPVQDEIISDTRRFLLSISDIPNLDNSKFSIEKLANIICDKYATKLVEDLVYTETTGIGLTNAFLSIRDKTMTIDEFREKLKNNNIKVLYPLKDKEYEPLNIDSEITLFKGTTYLSNNSMVPANMNITVDRLLNRVVEFTEKAKLNPTPYNISIARMWSNLIKESLVKDKYQNAINEIIHIDDSIVDKKNTTSNLDLYIKPKNTLILSSNTNFISFENFSGAEDMDNSIDITVSSSLPYSLNAYLPMEIQNADKTAIMDKTILNIKESNESTYKNFINTTDKITLKDICLPGNDIKHQIDIKLKGGITYKKDVYKATIKFEVEQK